MHLSIDLLGINSYKGKLLGFSKRTKETMGERSLAEQPNSREFMQQTGIEVHDVSGDGSRQFEM